MRATPSSSAPHSATDAAIRTGVILLTLFSLGYLTLLAALYLPISRLMPHRRVVRWALIGYATLTVLLWFVMGERTLLGYSTTACEVALVGLVVLEGKRLRARGDAGGL
jgi:quinol-cytochrome oxidoreductase complex cytochrome b subunit